MPPRRKASGLTDEDVARLRDQLAEGRRPRVALSGPQFEAGASGSVVRIGDPATDGADFLTVRVKVNGVTDELAFAPSELSTGRSQAKATAGRPARTPAARTRKSPAPDGAAAGSGSAGTASESVAAEAVAPATASSAAGTGTPAAGTPAASGAGRRRKVPPAPTVSVTISSSGAAWSVSASRGARTLLKNAPLTPGVVSALAELLGQPSVSEAVAEINEAARQLAQQRAEQLRAELSDLEAILATHRSPR